MKKIMIAGLFVCLSLLTGAQTTETVYLSGRGSDDAVEWDFYCTKGRNSGEWARIKVPSCWETEGFGYLTYGYRQPFVSDEEGLYKTTFKADPSWKGKRVFVVFEGSMTDTEVKVNGKKLGEIHQGSFYRFKREMTGEIKFNSDNLLEVKVSKRSANNSVNRAERDADFWVFGGIFRPVYIEVVPQEFIEYTAVDAKHTGEISAHVYLKEPLDKVEVEMEIFDSKGRSAGRFTEPASPSKTTGFVVNGKVSGVLPWTSETPNLYTAKISVKRNGKTFHTVTERIGFRTVEVRERDGIYVNGAKVRFKGVNRHSHYPTTGRTTNKALSIRDAELMKEMNMNAVRMSHYPPDRHFLEVCDSLGLYVIDELCAWQRPPYDTPVGTILVREMLTRDLNHPSIIMWANGNEGGFNFDLDPIFKAMDPQKRAVIHPWDLHDGINTDHYINFLTGIKSMFNGRDIFMPTELLHGLYDGGHGAGLDDFWNEMMRNPRAGGIFLWDYADQAVARPDDNGRLDTSKDYGADGIVGPFREKEGSFFTIKQIWSPVQLERRYLAPAWNGRLTVENNYHFTNTDQCSFTYRLSRFDGFSADKEVSLPGNIQAPSIAPGEKGTLGIPLPVNWSDYDFLYVTVKDGKGQELFTWTYEIGGPAQLLARTLPEIRSTARIAPKDAGDSYVFSANGVNVEIDKQTGFIKTATSGGVDIPLTNGPRMVAERTVEAVKVTGGENVTAVYDYGDKKGDRAYTFVWSMLPSGVMELAYNYKPKDNTYMVGITFDFPESGVEGATLLANGPYRVYNNRLKGGSVAMWEKTYNNTRTGESWEYPEFKGFYSLFYGMRLHCPKPFSVYTASEDMFLHLFTPEVQRDYAEEKNYTNPRYPDGNISFMDAIPSVGTKFGKAEDYGPQSQRHSHNRGFEFSIDNKLYFQF